MHITGNRKALDSASIRGVRSVYLSYAIGNQSSGGLTIDLDGSVSGSLGTSGQISLRSTNTYAPDGITRGQKQTLLTIAKYLSQSPATIQINSPDGALQETFNAMYLTARG